MAAIFSISGSGRVSFSTQRSYMKAVNAAFVEIKTPKFVKKVSVAHEKLVLETQIS